MKTSDRRIRQNKILDLIARRPVRTQQELAALLGKRGVVTTQSTLSKDIKELGLVKAPDQEGGLHYSAPAQNAAPHRHEVLQRELLDYLTGCDLAQNFLVLKTAAGNASGVCAAIDAMRWPEVVGTVAGDDNIFIACKTSAHARSLRRRIEEITDGGRR